MGAGGEPQAADRDDGRLVLERSSRAERLVGDERPVRGLLRGQESMGATLAGGAGLTKGEAG